MQKMRFTKNEAIAYCQNNQEKDLTLTFDSRGSYYFFKGKEMAQEIESSKVISNLDTLILFPTQFEEFKNEIAKDWEFDSIDYDWDDTGVWFWNDDLGEVMHFVPYAKIKEATIEDLGYQDNKLFAQYFMDWYFAHLEEWISIALDILVYDIAYALHCDYNDKPITPSILDTSMRIDFEYSHPVEELIAQSC